MGHRLVGQRTGGGAFNRPPRGHQRPPERIGWARESEHVFVAVDGGEHSPAIALIRCISDDALQQIAHDGVLLRGHAFVQPEDPEDRLVGAQLRVGLVPDHRGDAMNQDAMLVGDGGDDPRNQLVLELEDGLGMEGALVGLSPQVGARRCVDELDRDAQLGACLAKASLNHIPRAQFLAGRTEIHRLARMSRG